MATTIQRYVARKPLILEAFGLGIDLPELEDEHPNRVPFHGILTRLNEPSTRPPGGSKGDDGKFHRVLIPTHVAETALASLIGMPVDSASRLDSHDKRQVIGVITRADIKDNDLIVSGHLFGKNFESEVREIQEKKDELGMSYEISSVLVEDPEADIWTLASLQFTGAAILRRNAAAYAKTAIAASAEQEDANMAFDEVTKKLDNMSRKLDTIFAERHDEDEDAARCHEEEAKRHEEEARHAREDHDEDAARQHDEEAAKAWVMAMRKHEEVAKRCEEDANAEEDAAAKEQLLAAAKTHQDAAAKIKDEDTARQEAARKVEEDATKAKDDEDAMAQFVGMLMRAMQHDEDEDAAGKKEKVMPLWAKALLSMSYPTMSKRKADAEHDDEEEDIKLFKRLLKNKTKMEASANQTQTVDIETRRRLRSLEASMELLTDKVSKVVTLLTDAVSKNRGLATDGNQGGNGGKVAQRKTMQATGESWVGKFEQKDNEGKLTPEEAEKLCAGLDARQALTKKLELMAAGRL